MIHRVISCVILSTALNAMEEDEGFQEEVRDAIQDSLLLIGSKRSEQQGSGSRVEESRMVDSCQFIVLRNE